MTDQNKNTDNGQDNDAKKKINSSDIILGGGMALAGLLFLGLVMAKGSDSDIVKDVKGDVLSKFTKFL